jgi:hypothetical protein
MTPRRPFRPGKERGGQTTGQSFQIGALTTHPLPPPACLADTPAAPDPAGSDGKTIRQGAYSAQGGRLHARHAPPDGPRWDAIGGPLGGAGGVVLEKKSVSPLIDGRASSPVTLPGCQHDPALQPPSARYPVHVPARGHHSGPPHDHPVWRCVPDANSTSPYADAAAPLRAAGERTDARRHLARQHQPDLQGRARRRLSAIRRRPQRWAGALSLGRKRPRRARQWIAHFNRWRNNAYGESGHTLE